VKLCSVATDTSVAIRRRVFQLLSQVPDISESLMLQSLSKNMMKVELERDAESQKQRNTFEGDPDSEKGQVVVVDVKNLNLIESGSYGAFVHGLEDEFYEVRAAAIGSYDFLSKTLGSRPRTHDSTDRVDSRVGQEFERVLQSLR
jgi:integrator complex subunit 4